MTAYIVCGAPGDHIPDHIAKGVLVIGVDRGALNLIEAGIAPDVAIGDFDSVTDSDRKLIQDKAGSFIQLPLEKDNTDAFAAVEYARSQGVTDVRLFGAIGGRMDHNQGALGMMLHYAKQGLSISSEDEKNRLRIFTPGSKRIIALHRYISFFALEGEVTNFTVSDVKYPLEGYTLRPDDALCISNEPLRGSVPFSFDSGHLLVITSDD